MSTGTDFSDISSYWQILRRRKTSFLLPFVLISAIGAAFAYLLPPVYKSEATILIEEVVGLRFRRIPMGTSGWVAPRRSRAAKQMKNRTGSH